MIKKIFIISLLLFIQLFFLVLNRPLKKENIEYPNISKQLSVRISQAHPTYLPYDELIDCVKKWETEAPDLVSVGVYGQSSKKQDLCYVRVFNKTTKTVKPVVLITACIHGNEPLSTATVMWYIGELLDGYNSNPEVKELIDNRDLFFVPIVSPDSYPSQRNVDGVDPNRNFPNLSNPDRQSVKPVVALQNLYLQIRPKAVLSGHTYGRVFLIPHGDTMQKCKDHDEFNRVVSKMAELSGYKNIRTCELYGAAKNSNDVPIRVYGENNNAYKVNVPIYGTEIDWYYRNGSFAVVVEFGTHQKKPSNNEIEYEFKRTWKAFLHFVKEAPLVNISSETMTLLSEEPELQQDFRDE